MKFLQDKGSSRDGFEIHRIERGGEVTFHTPGQLVCYPILNLNHHKRDLHWYVRSIEEVVIVTLRSFGLQGERIKGLTGVWVDQKKVAAIGMSVSKWVTMHGFSINISCSLDGFGHIVPCGLQVSLLASTTEGVMFTI